MQDPALFPFIDSAVRLIAVLALCLAPFLIPLPRIKPLDRRWRALRAPSSQRAAAQRPA